nr:hypothetical protein [Paraburkholderia atlantica]
MARASGRARPSASGHPSARLRAEEPEAGIQARGVRTVRRDARRGEARSHAHRDERADPVAGAARSGRGADGRAGRSSGERRVPSCRVRGSRRRRAGCCRSGHRRNDRRRDEPWPRPRRSAAGGRAHEYRQRAEGRPQRPVPVRQRQEVQAVPRQDRLMPTRRASWRAASF